MGRYSQLPEAIRLEDTVTSEDVFDADRSTDQTEVDWVLQNTAS